MTILRLSNCFRTSKLTCFHPSLVRLKIRPLFRFPFLRINPFWIQLFYFITVSLFGYVCLKVLKQKPDSVSPKAIDVFFTSVSATTVSSMSSVEMEVFSNTQLVILTTLMLIGGEVFTSMLGLQLAMFKFTIEHNQVDTNFLEKKPDDMEQGNYEEGGDEDLIKPKSVKCLGYVVLAYHLIIHICGSVSVYTYLSLVASAKEILNNKGLKLETFSVFATVSTFSNCGFIPTNENMMAFKKSCGLLLLLIPQILLGNTLFPPCLRLVIWVLERTTKRIEFTYILTNFREMGYNHLLSNMHCCCLALTALGFILLQFILFCTLEWNSQGMDDLNSYQKLVTSLFQVVNSRHSGESVFDISMLSPAILVVFVVMMYFPPYTSFLPVKDDDARTGRKQRKQAVEDLLFSQLAYVVIFIVLICITESRKMKEDPLNFNVLNITIEVISAYGNVGFSTGYSCKRQLQPDKYCKDTWYGFVGRWSNGGKLLLIIVMFFGRLKKFNMKGGRAWNLS